jgi:hypothetical protein
MSVFGVLAAVIVAVILFAWARRAIRVRVSTMAVQGQPGGQQGQRMDPANEILAGTIAGVENAGVDADGQPLVSIDLDVYQTDGTQLRRTVRSATARILKSGDSCVVAVDIKDPVLVYFADSPLIQGGQSSTRLRMLEALPAQFSGRLAVGDIVVDSNNYSDGGPGNVQVSMTHIGYPPLTVWCRKEPSLSVGDRAFVKLDALSPPRAGSILPLKFTAGERLISTGNRTDGLVLAEDLLASGSKAQGTIVSVKQVPMPAVFTQAGFSKWVLQVSVVPENGTTPYTATITQGLTVPDRVPQISQVGTVLPIRFDPYDPQTCRLDTVSLGWRRLVEGLHADETPVQPAVDSQPSLRETLLQETQPLQETSPEDEWKELRKWT